MFYQTGLKFMKRLAVVILLAAIFSLVALYFIYPESIEKIWLWLVGLIGTIIAFFQKTGDWIDEKIKRFSKQKTTEVAVENIFMKIFRYTRSGNRVLGLVYIGGKFIGISSEDSRNPGGEYKLDIQNNKIIVSGTDFLVHLVTCGQGSSNENNIILCADENSSGSGSGLVFNAVFELLSNWSEQEKQAWLKIYEANSLIEP